MLRWLCFDVELHDTWTERSHFKLLQRLVVGFVVSRPDVDQFPVDGVDELSQALKRYAELDSGGEGSLRVLDQHVANVN